MLESNRIEGEDRLNPGDFFAWTAMITREPMTEERVLTTHKMLTQHLKVDWSGRYRKVGVAVGHFKPATPANVPILMKDFFEQLYLMDSWTAHNIFEAIHPFRDFNGRMGRLIWLNKALKDWKYDYSIPFLQAYYYQTLEHQQKVEE